MLHLLPAFLNIVNDESAIWVYSMLQRLQTSV